MTRAVVAAVFVVVICVSSFLYASILRRTRYDAMHCNVLKAAPLLQRICVGKDLPQRTYPEPALLPLGDGVYVQSVRLGSGSRFSAVPPESVQVLPTRPTTAHTEIALLSAAGRNHVSTQELLRALRGEASRLGANRILIESMSAEPADKNVIGNRIARALAIRQ